MYDVFFGNLIVQSWIENKLFLNVIKRKKDT